MNPGTLPSAGGPGFSYPEFFRVWSTCFDYTPCPGWRRVVIWRLISDFVLRRCVVVVVGVVDSVVRLFAAVAAVVTVALFALFFL